MKKRAMSSSSHIAMIINWLVLSKNAIKTKKSSIITMKKQLIPFLFILIFGCTKHDSKSKIVETVDIKPTLITDSVMTNFPGRLIVSGNYLVWSDPFNYSAFLKVVDIRTGKQVAQAGQAGQGPKEFVTPSVDLLCTDKISVTDLNANKRAVVDIEKLVKEQDAFSYFKKTGLKGATRYKEIEPTKFVGLYPKSRLLFKVIDHNKAIEFGRFPIKETLHERDKYNHFQGNIAYNPNREQLIYCPFNFPYIMSYKRSDNSFTQHKILKIFEVKYSFVNGDLKFKERITLISEMAITKDYIVVARPKEFKKDIDINTGMQKRPHTLYLYDYELNLVKIIDTKVPICRLAGNEKSNTVYAIVTNPEYSIVKIELPKVDM